MRSSRSIAHILLFASSIKPAFTHSQQPLRSMSQLAPASRVHVLLKDSSLEALKSIVEDTELSKDVIGITFDTDRDREEDRRKGELDEDMEEEDEINLKAFKKAIRLTYRFPNLNQLCVKFNPESESNEEDGNYRYGDVDDDVDFRHGILRTVFTALDSTKHPMPNLKSLSLVHLQNFNEDNLVSAPQFHSTLSRLNELRLKIATEYSSSAPESSWSFPQLYEFFDSFASIWLKPTSENVESLKLHCDTEWGYMPRADFRGVHFPKLKKLDLGNYVFSHEWQLEWILSHASTLEELILNYPAIIPYVYNYGSVDAENYPLQPTSDFGDVHSWVYSGKWSHYFSQFEEKLPNLKLFKFGTGKNDGYEKEDGLDSGGLDFENNEFTQYGCFKRRYLAFNRGIGPSPWQEVEEFIEQSSHPAYGYKLDYEPVDVVKSEQEADDAAYDKLMGTLEKRREAVAGTVDREEL